MKKMNNKGFTLIELLAVITIMGILMMVAIPSVSRTIENARRDTFADIAHEYINAVRNGVLADQIECKLDASVDKWTVASGTPDGWYYFQLDTTQTSTTDLMESGGLSPFGNTDMKGCIVWRKNSTTNTAGDLKTKTTYWMRMVDTGQHGFDTWKGEASIKRAQISTKTTGTAATVGAAPTTSDKPDGTNAVASPKKCRIS